MSRAWKNGDPCVSKSGTFSCFFFYQIPPLSFLAGIKGKWESLSPVRSLESLRYYVCSISQVPSHSQQSSSNKPKPGKPQTITMSQTPTAADTILRYSMISCCSYFTAMATAHFFSIKYPILFVYWDTPFYAYQDKIISFCALNYAVLFCGAIKHPKVTPFAILAMVNTVIGLSLVNTSDDLAKVLNGKTTKWYWAQVAFIAGLTGWLAFWWSKSSHGKKKNRSE